MKTTELFVEQVLIGFLVLLVGALVFWEDVYALAVRINDKSLNLIATVGLLVGAAYLIGIVYDRIADTLLQDIESHGRLQFALARFELESGNMRTGSIPPEKIAEGDIRMSTDPFEDGKYRIMVLSNSEATTQMEYLRSRIRLTRSMATIIPALMIALLLAVETGEAGFWWNLAALTIPFAYAITLFLKTLKCWRLFEVPPKTYQLEKVRDYIKRAGMQCDRKKNPWRAWRLIAHDEAWLGMLLLTLSGIALVLKSGVYELLWLMVIGFLLTIVVGWTWWRISMTFYAFIRNYAKYAGTREQTIARQ